MFFNEMMKLFRVRLLVRSKLFPERDAGLAVSRIFLVLVHDAPETFVFFCLLSKQVIQVVFMHRV